MGENNNEYILMLDLSFYSKKSEVVMLKYLLHHHAIPKIHEASHGGFFLLKNHLLKPCDSEKWTSLVIIKDTAQKEHIFILAPLSKILNATH